MNSQDEQEGGLWRMARNLAIAFIGIWAAYIYGKQRGRAVEQAKEVESVGAGKGEKGIFGGQKIIDNYGFSDGSFKMVCYLRCFALHMLSVEGKH
jgi:hypothetical protein